MSLSELNEAVARSGGTWIGLREKGDRVEGTIIDFEERPKTFEGEPVLSRKSGQQRMEWVFTLQTGESEGAADDGVRKVSLDENGQRAVKKAIKDAGSPAVVGGTLIIAVVADRETPTSQCEKKAKYTPPVKEIAVPVDGDF